MIIDNPITSRTLADFAQTLTSQDKARLMDLVDSNLDLSQYPQEWQKIIRGKSVQKHGTHDQKTHGNWATGGMGAGVADSILSRVRENGGLSVNMVDGSEPTSGYMVAKGAQFGSIVSADDFYDPIKGPKALADYFKRHKKELGAGKNYLGVWHNKDDGQVYLDVSENIQDRERAISAGQKQDQISIWDVTNFAEIETGGTGSVEKTGSGRDTKEHRGDDRFGDRSLRSENLGEVGKAYKVIRFEPGLIPVLKHGEHDQSSHGNWADGTFNEETEGGNAQDEYFERYGFEPLTGDPAGTTREEIDALGYYATAGYRDINEGLREGWQNENDAPRIANLDTLIENSPDIFGDKTLYRVMSDQVIADLQPGDILVDKGYTSTTRVDITNDENMYVRQDLLSISDTNNTVAVILPNERRNGKGLAVDMYANATDGVTRTNGVLTAQAEREKEVLLPRSTALKFIGIKDKVAVFQRTDE